MTDRFNPFPIVSHALVSLRRRASAGRERQDWVAVLIMTVLPLGCALVSVRFGWTVQHADSLVAGFSLLTASLLAVVPQFAAWRQRLTERDSRSEGVARRKIDEAVVHTLLGVLVSVGLAVLSIILSNLISPGDGITLPLGVREAITAVIMAGGTYLVLTLMLVVNLLFDAYQDANGLTAAQNDHPGVWEDEQDVA